MRLYSRTQLIVAAVSSAVFTLLAVIAIGPLVDGGQAGGSTSQGQQSATGSSPGTAGGFVLQTGDSALDSPASDDDSGLSLDELETIRVFEARNDGVVNISTQRVTLNWFFEPIPEQGQSGSGSIIDQRGYVLTNNHVVRGASEITVTLADGTSLPGEVIGTDPENDLAVLKIDPQGRELTTIPLGRSDNLRVGQKVLAIGNPFAIGRTLTTGVVSGLDRSVRADANFVINGLIQTDASINPGNSGGPLLNSRGDMIGINTMIYSSTGGSIGIGFAVPSETARRVVPDLIEFGVVRRGWIEMTPVQLFPQLVRFARLSVSSGLLVSQVEPGGNADRAGLRGGSPANRIEYRNSIIFLGGDVVIRVNGVRTTTLANLFEALESTRAGQEVAVTYVRGGREVDTTVTLVERPQRVRM